MFLRNAWYVAALDRELDEPMVARRILDEPVVLYRTDDGVAALEDVCPHRLVPLSAGERVGNDVVCGYHGLRFGPNGACTNMPGRTRIPASAKVRAYPAVLRWRLVWIWMGAPELADPALIPDLFWIDSEDWRTVSGHLPVAADYRLINDNLLDLTHESYVHVATIANGNRDEMGDYPLKLHAGENMLCAERVMPDVVTPPGLIDVMGIGARIDREQRAIFTTPSTNLSDSRMLSREPGSNGSAGHRIMHLLTPETESSTHYFYTGSRDYGLDQDWIGDAMVKLVDKALGEDRAMLEMQQAALLRMGNPKFPRVAWSIDEAPVKGRRMLEALIAAESANPAAVSTPSRLTRLTPLSADRLI